MKMDMGANLMTLGEDTISIQYGNKPRETRVSRVTVAKRRVIPPHSVTAVICQLQGTMPDYVLEPDQNSHLVIPRSAHRSKARPTLYVANVTNSFVVMKPGQAVGEAVEADSLPKIQDTASG